MHLSCGSVWQREEDSGSSYFRTGGGHGEMNCAIIYMDTLFRCTSLSIILRRSASYYSVVVVLVGDER